MRKGKLEDLLEQAEKVGLNINAEKTKSLRINTRIDSKFQTNESDVDDVRLHISWKDCI